MHYYDKINGIKDFDVWFFFQKNEHKKLPVRKVLNSDIIINDKGKEIKKRIDILFRGIDINPNLTVTENIQNYLNLAKTKTSKKLAEKAVVLLKPNNLMGEVIWYKQKL